MKTWKMLFVIWFFSITALGQEEKLKDDEGKGELMAYNVKEYRSIWSFSYTSSMIPEFIDGSEVTFRLVGRLQEVTKIAMTTSSSDCTVLQESTISDIRITSGEELFTTVLMPTLLTNSEKLYFCFKSSGVSWKHQGNEDWAYIIVVKRLLSLPTIIIIIVLCVIISGLLNGLVLGLMSLDITELKVIANAGGEKEKKYGKAILSVRKRGNFLLISLVVGATTLNSTVTVLVDQFVSEWMTVLIVTLTIVLFCEIIPNSIISRFALTIGGKTIYLTWLVMIITSPVSYPLGKLLDKLLGEDIPNLTRDRLKELVKITADVSSLKKTEIDMISGALEMSARKVEDIMTLLEDIYSVPIETLLDYESIREIITSGYSRIPIYDGEKSNIVKIMYVRDLALIDPEDKTPLMLFAKLMTDQEIVYVGEGTTIDAVFNIFKEGVHGHMAFVVKPQQSGNPRIVTGLLTLEDIIEEIVQVEIVDEYDVIVDNRSKRKRQRYRMISDYMSVFADNFESKSVLISPNLRIAALNFLASELKEFTPEVISPKVLQRLLRQGVIVHLPKKKLKSLNPLIFSQSQAYEGFVMILEGRAQIVIGPDNLRCECGPFSYFGLGILSEYPDEKMTYGYTVEAIGEVRYLKIPRELYLAAIEATRMEKGLPGNVPPPYRGLLADDEERETSEMSKSFHMVEHSKARGINDSKTTARAESRIASESSREVNSNESAPRASLNERQASDSSKGISFRHSPKSSHDSKAGPSTENPKTEESEALPRRNSSESPTKPQPDENKRQNLESDDKPND